MSSYESLKALSLMRRPKWIDMRPRSPKVLGDMSSIILPRVTAASGAGAQDLDYDLLAQLHVCNDLAWTCIDYISSTLALGRLVVRKRTSGGVEYLPDHPFQKLLDFPNSSMTQFDLIQSYSTHQLLFGTIGIVLERNGMDTLCPLCVRDKETVCEHRLYYFNSGEIEQLMVVHPSNFNKRDIEFANGVVKSCFTYIQPSGKEIVIHPNNLLTDPLYNTDISFYGVSPTHLLKRWLNLDSVMTEQISTFFKNGAIPSMLVTLKPPPEGSALEDEPKTILEMLKGEWMKKFGKGGNEEKTPAFLYGDIGVERLQQAVNELISKELYFEIQNRVCATYGVPPNLYEFGLKYASQKASAEQMEKTFFNKTISPKLMRIKRKINQQIAPSFREEGLEVVWDLSEMGIASFLTEKKEMAIERRWEKGLFTRDKALTALGEPPVGGEIGSEYYRRTITKDGLDTGKPIDNNLVTDNSVEPGVVE